MSIRGYGYAGAPGIYSNCQIEGWRRVTDAVYRKGGRIFLQLWHVGRQSHTDLQPNGGAPVAPSAIRAEGHAYSKNGEVEFSMPRALELHEIGEFRAGAERALRAGFDGVEIQAFRSQARKVVGLAALELMPRASNDRSLSSGAPTDDVPVTREWLRRPRPRNG